MHHSGTSRSKSHAVLILVLVEGVLFSVVVFASVGLANGAGWLRHLF